MLPDRSGPQASGATVRLRIASPDISHDVICEPDCGFSNLAVEPYATAGGFYVFDAKNVVFFEVDELVFSILSILRMQNLGVDRLISLLPHHPERAIREAYQEIRTFQDDGYLTQFQVSRPPPHNREYIETTLSSGLSGFTLYVTNRCNLACSYCIYSGQYARYGQFSRNSMTWDTAKSAIDFLLEHSRNSKTLRLDFFGGEPMLAFDLIKRSVQYAKLGNRPDGPPLTISVATNGTILTDEILGFLLEHSVYLQFSIDGDKSTHDQNRRFSGSNLGSYDVVIKNLERIYNHDPDYFREYLRIKCVLTPEELELNGDRLLDHPLTDIVNDQGHLSYVIKELQYDIGQDSFYLEALHRVGRTLLERRGVETISELLECLTARQKLFFDATFAAFWEVQAVNSLLGDHSERAFFTKRCLMGYEGGAVLPSGDIAICHKATSFIIGNVNEGVWYFDKICKLNSQLYEEWPECSSCFLVKFCDLCYEKLDGESERWTTSRSRFCAFRRHYYHAIFEYMLGILDRNPSLWRDMENPVRKNIKDRFANRRS